MCIIQFILFSDNFWAFIFISNGLWSVNELIRTEKRQRNKMNFSFVNGILQTPHVKKENVRANKKNAKTMFAVVVVVKDSMRKLFYTN